MFYNNSKITSLKIRRLSDHYKLLRVLLHWSPPDKFSFACVWCERVWQEVWEDDRCQKFVNVQPQETNVRGQLKMKKKTSTLRSLDHVIYASHMNGTDGSVDFSRSSLFVPGCKLSTSKMNSHDHRVSIKSGLIFLKFARKT